MGLWLGAVQGAWVGMGGWVSGLCVGLGAGARGCVCVWLLPGATCGGQGWG